MKRQRARISWLLALSALVVAGAVVAHAQSRSASVILATQADAARLPADQSRALLGNVL